MTVRGFTPYELAKIQEIAKALADFNRHGLDAEGIQAEVTLWRDGDEVAAVTEFEGGGVRLISKETPS